MKTPLFLFIITKKSRIMLPDKIYAIAMPENIQHMG